MGAHFDNRSTCKVKIRLSLCKCEPFHGVLTSRMSYIHTRTPYIMYRIPGGCNTYALERARACMKGCVLLQSVFLILLLWWHFRECHFNYVTCSQGATLRYGIAYYRKNATIYNGEHTCMFGQQVKQHLGGVLKINANGKHPQHSRLSPRGWKRQTYSSK